MVRNEQRPKTDRPCRATSGDQPGRSIRRPTARPARMTKTHSRAHHKKTSTNLDPTMQFLDTGSASRSLTVLSENSRPKIQLVTNPKMRMPPTATACDRRAK